jgi:WD40 repeat protein
MAGRLDNGSQVWVGRNWEIQLDFDAPTYPALLTEDHFATVSTDETGSALTIYDTATGTQLGEMVRGGFARDQAASADEQLMAVAFNSANDATSGSIAILELATGDEVARIDEANGPTALVFEPNGHRLVVGLRGGEVLTIDGDTGQVVQRTATDAVVGYSALGFLPDGRLVGVTRGAINLIDRADDEVITAIELSNVAVAVVRPDGLIVTVDDRGKTDVYDLETSPLVDQQWAADGFSWVSIVDGLAAVVDRPAEALEVVDLADGSRQTLELRTETGELFEAKAMYAEPDGVWAMDAELVLGRWEGGVMVDRLDVGSTPEAVWIPYGNHPAGERFGDHYAVLGLLPGGTREAILVQLERGDPSVVFRIDDVDTSWVHPTADGGMLVISVDGMLRCYDEAGALAGEPIATGAAEPYGVTLSRDGSTMAMGSLGSSTVTVVDLERGDVHGVPVNGLVSTLGITPDGSQLMLAMFDGSVRLYDVAERTVPTVVWNGTGAFSSAPGWYDETTSAMWIHSGGQLLSIPLDAARWVESACQIVGRDLTQEEWDRLVPGDQPYRSVCD